MEICRRLFGGVTSIKGRQIVLTQRIGAVSIPMKAYRTNVIMYPAYSARLAI